jgi:biotin carboxyl carrier protein
MKYVVNIADKQYEVEIEDIYARPVIARLDGQKFVVNPEEGSRHSLQEEPKGFTAVALPKQSSISDADISELSAPLPGTVIEVFVRAGDVIETGQVVLVIEAMKMKNSIRSTRAGKITDVLVSAGQTVAHKQPLVRFG